MHDYVIIKLDSDTVKVISKINAKYIFSVTTEKGKDRIIREILKGTLRMYTIRYSMIYYV